MQKNIFVLALILSLASIGAYEYSPQGFITLNNGTNKFLAFHSKMIQRQYNLTTHFKNWKIIASIDEPMPTGTNLFIKVSSMKGTSLGIVDLSNGSPKSVVVGYGKVFETNQDISCTVVSGTRLGRTVTLNLREW